MCCNALSKSRGSPNTYERPRVECTTYKRGASCNAFASEARASSLRLSPICEPASASQLRGLSGYFATSCWPSASCTVRSLSNPLRVIWIWSRSASEAGAAYRSASARLVLNSSVEFAVFATFRYANAKVESAVTAALKCSFASMNRPRSNSRWPARKCVRAAADEVVRGCSITALVTASSAARPSWARTVEYGPHSAATSAARAITWLPDCIVASDVESVGERWRQATGGRERSLRKRQHAGAPVITQEECDES